MSKAVYDSKVGAEVSGEVFGSHVCPSCKVRMVEDKYRRCYGCQAKWWKVFEDCCAIGWPDDYARMRADQVYPSS